MVDCRFYPQLLGLLCSLFLSSLAPFFFSLCPLMPTFPLFFFLFLAHAHKFHQLFLRALSNTVLSSLFFFLWLTLLPIIQAREKCASAVFFYYCTLSLYIVFGETGRGLQLISLFRSLLWSILPHLLLCVCVFVSGVAYVSEEYYSVCGLGAIMLNQTCSHSKGIISHHFIAS